MAQNNFSISLRTNFNNNQLLRKNMFNMNKNKKRVIRQPNNANIKPSVNHKVLS